MDHETDRTARLGGGPAAGTGAERRLAEVTGPTVRAGGDGAPGRENGVDPHAQAGPSHVVLGRYRLERRIGRGGFGVVWRAWDEQLERDVAVKEIPGTDATDRRRGESSQRALREAQAAARLNHANVAALYEFGAEGGATYLVSELVRGASLDELIERDALSDRDIGRVGIAVARGLEHAHERGVIHRDVKPANIMVAAGGGPDAKLMDFGVAHMRTADTLTATGDVLGTLAYMAPEQAEGRRVTEAVDTYALALTLYEAWSGENPMRGDNPADTARRVGRPVQGLRRARPDLPRELADAVDAALAVAPADRPALHVFRAALEDSLGALSDQGGLDGGLLAAVRGRPFPLVSEQVRRVAAGVAAAGLALVGALALPTGPPASPALIAPAVGLLVAALPRAGWTVSALAAVAWLGLPAGAGLPGAALVLACALAPVPLLLPLAGRAWSVPALAPVLGLAGLASLYVPGAGAAGRAWRRVALAIAGFWWLALAEVSAHRTLLAGPPAGARRLAVWQDSLSGAVNDALVPLVTSPEMAYGALWGILALVFPWLVRGRTITWDLVGVTVWAAGMVSAQRVLHERLDAGAVEPRGLVVSGVLTVAAVAAAHALQRRPGA